MYHTSAGADCASVAKVASPLPTPAAPLAVAPRIDTVAMNKSLALRELKVKPEGNTSITKTKKTIEKKGHACMA